jgi:hypothetical protein
MGTLWLIWLALHSFYIYVDSHTRYFQVKPRFTQYRREIRLHATAEAKAAYQLNPGQGSGERVQGLLLDDTFVYGIDNRVCLSRTPPVCDWLIQIEHSGSC